MTLGECISLIDELSPNAFSESVKTHWINTVEGFIQQKVMKQYKKLEVKRKEGVLEYPLPEGITIDDVIMVKIKNWEIPKVTVKSGRDHTYYGVVNEDGEHSIRLNTKPAQDDTKPQLEIFYQEPFKPYSYQDDRNKELLAPPPHTEVYIQYCLAQIEFSNREYGAYNNTMEQYNNAVEEFSTWWKARNPTRVYTARNYW